MRDAPYRLPARAGRLRRSAKRPCANGLPSTSTTTWSHSSATSPMLCSMIRKVMPRALQRQDVRAEPPRERRIDAGGRLVEQDQLRLGHQRAAELEQLFLPAREIDRAIVADLREIELARDRRSRAGAIPPRARAPRAVRSTAAQKVSPGWCLP